MHGVGLYPAVGFGQVLKAVELCPEVQLVDVGGKPIGQYKRSHTFFNLVLVVVEQSPYAMSAYDFCNHCSASLAISISALSTFSPTFLYRSAVFIT